MTGRIALAAFASGLVLAVALEAVPPDRAPWVVVGAGALALAAALWRRDP